MDQEEFTTRYFTVSLGDTTETHLDGPNSCRPVVGRSRGQTPSAHTPRDVVGLPPG